MNKQHQINFWYVMAALIVILLLQNYWVQSQRIDHIPYSEFRTLLEAGNVADVVVTETTIRGRLKTPGEGK